MGDLNPFHIPRNFKPRELLQFRGLSRPPVGGVGLRGETTNAAAISQASPAMVVKERGLTYPVTVGLVAFELQPIDVDRKFLFIQNNDPVGKVTVSFGGNTATLGIGFNLAPGGGGILLDMNVPTARIFIIGSIASNPNVTMVIG